MASKLVIDVVSDTICPWCFVGKRRLEKALAAVGAEATIRWHPFFLDPSLPAEGVDKMARYRDKFGAARVAQMLPYMTSVGLEEGIRFSFKGRIGRTLDSHRLIEFAWREGGAEVQDRVVEELFHAYFEHEQNVGERSVLVEAAARAGLDRARVEAFLASDELRDAVLEEAETLRETHDITGVPFFIINDKYSFGGAQDVATLVRVLDKVGARRSTTGRGAAPGAGAPEASKAGGARIGPPAAEAAGPGGCGPDGCPLPAEAADDASR